MNLLHHPRVIIIRVWDRDVLPGRYTKLVQSPLQSRHIRHHQGDVANNEVIIRMDAGPAFDQMEVHISHSQPGSMSI